MPTAIVVVPEGEEICISSSSVLEDICIIGEPYFKKYKKIDCDFFSLYDEGFDDNKKADSSDGGEKSWGNAEEKERTFRTWGEPVPDYALVRLCGRTEEAEEGARFSNVYIAGSCGSGIIMRNFCLSKPGVVVTDCSSSCLVAEGNSYITYGSVVFSRSRTGSGLVLKGESSFDYTYVRACGNGEHGVVLMDSASIRCGTDHKKDATFIMTYNNGGSGIYASGSATISSPRIRTERNGADGITADGNITFKIGGISSRYSKERNEIKAFNNGECGLSLSGNVRIKDNICFPDNLHLGKRKREAHLRFLRLRLLD